MRYLLVLLAFALPAAAQEGAPVADFADIDDDGNQLITREEALRQDVLGPAFDELDRNRDNRLDPQEFAAMGPPLGERDTLYETQEAPAVRPLEPAEAPAEQARSGELEARQQRIEELTAELRGKQGQAAEQ